MDRDCAQKDYQQCVEPPFRLLTDWIHEAENRRIIFTIVWSS